MKKLIIIIFSSLTFTIANAQKRILIDDASKNIGQKVIICDSVYSIKVLSSLTFLNIGGDYPKQKLTLVFYKKDLYLLNVEPETMYKFKKVCISGKLIQYEGKPQMVIKALKQITNY